MTTKHVFAGILTAGLGLSSLCLADPTTPAKPKPYVKLAQGEGARLIKKFDKSIVKVRGASEYGGKAFGVDARGRVKLFDVNRETKQVKLIDGNIGAKMIARVKERYAPLLGKSAKVTLGDAIGDASVLSKSGQHVRIGISYGKRSSKADLNVLTAAAGRWNEGSGYISVSEDPADTGVAVTKAIKKVNKLLGYTQEGKNLEARTIQLFKNKLLVAAAPSYSLRKEKMEGRILEVDRKTGKVKVLSGNLAKKAERQLAAFEKGRGHKLVSYKMDSSSYSNQNLAFEVKYASRDAKGQQEGRERFYDMKRGKLWDSNRDGHTTDGE